MLNSTVQDENKKKAKTNPNLISLDGQNFEVIPDIAIHSSRWLIEIYQRLGRPQNPFTETGKKMMDVIITAWFNLYPIESRIWLDERRNYQNTEKSITEQVHTHTGRSLASYPMPIFKMMKIVFPDFKPAERKNCIKMVKRWPIFRMANKV